MDKSLDVNPPTKSASSSSTPLSIPQQRVTVTAVETTISPRFLNFLGYINYDHYGNEPWKNDESAEIFLSEEYTSITNFLAIDCETVLVGQPPVHDLGRVSIVNEYGYCLYDTFVSPTKKIVDYGSSIRPENLKNAPTLSSVAMKITELVKEKIIVGHSMHHNLRILQLTGHRSIRDTSMYFKEKTKANRLLCLQKLAKEYLNVTFQMGNQNTIQNAQIVMKLYCDFREPWGKSLPTKKIKFDCGHTDKVPRDADSSTLKCTKKLLKVLPCRHQLELSCLESPLNVKCTICVAKEELIAQAGPPKEIDANIAKIPSKYLNSIGLINYDHYGNVPWTDNESSEIFLSPEYKSVTPFLGIDCEMVGAGARGHISSVGRVSIVNEYGYCIYDTFVHPMVYVTDYRTKYSGIRAEDIANAPPKNAVLQRVAELVRGKTLVGHDIVNDLRVLHMNDYPAIRDTAKYFQQKTNAALKPSLKVLTRDYLNGTIQMGEHSSIEDSQAAMKLYTVFREHWEKYIQSNPDQTDKEKITLPSGQKRKLPRDEDISGSKCDKRVKKYLPCASTWSSNRSYYPK